VLRAVAVLAVDRHARSVVRTDRKLNFASSQAKWMKADTLFGRLIRQYGHMRLLRDREKKDLRRQNEAKRQPAVRGPSKLCPDACVPRLVSRPGAVNST
jgi:hypothetical protein